MADVLSIILLEAKFRDVSFPVTDFRIQISQDVAQHKRPDQDGARVEATGRNPMTFSASIPFHRGLARGVYENWPELYPGEHRRFLAAMADRSTGILTCPSFGEVKVKPVSCTSNLKADMRSGEEVSAEWIEFSENEDESESLFSNASPLNGALDAALTLDDMFSSPVIQKVDPDNGVSIFDLMTSVAAAFDTASLLAKRTLAVIDRLAYRLNMVHTSVSALADPQMWDVKQRITRLIDALRRIKMLGLGVTSDVSIYIVPSRTTVGNLASKLQTTVSLLLQLNPSLASRFYVSEGEVVRYYKQSVPPAAVVALSGGILAVPNLVETR